MQPALTRLLLSLLIAALLAGCATDNEPAMDIWTAAATGNVEVIREHISYGTDVNERDPLGGSTPLIVAALVGQTEVARVLVEHGTNLDATNNDGSTALLTAAFFCRVDTVKYLLGQGARTDIRNNFGSTPLESVSSEWSAELEELYVRFDDLLKLNLDLDYIRTTRPLIADLIRQHAD